MSDDVPTDDVEPQRSKREKRDGWGRFASKRRTDDPAPAGEAPKDRASGGRFAKGNKVAVGRGRTSREFDAALRERVTPEVFAKIIDRLIEQACDGDGIATKSLLDRLLGRAREAAPRVDIGLAEITNSKDVAKLLYAAMSAAARGELSPSDVGSFASASREAHAAIEFSDLQQRVADLERGVRSGRVAAPSSAPDAPL